MYNDNLSLDDMLEQQIRSEDEIGIFKESTKPQIKEKKEKKALTFQNALKLLRGKIKFLNGFESGIFTIKNRNKEKDIL